MEERVIDSQQQTDMDWIPDSQPRSRDRRQVQDMKVVVYVVIGVISTLVELIIPEPNQPEPPATTLITHTNLEDAISPFKRRLAVWGQFMQQNLSVLRLLHFVFESKQLRRILCPWYIKPRTIEWFYLYLDWTPTEDPIRFCQFFRITPTMFAQICGMMRGDMASRALAAFHCLPNRDLIVKRQVAVGTNRDLIIERQANERWNNRHSSARMCVERGFGRLKGTWRILSRKILMPRIDRLATTVYSCALLHNMVIERGDEIPPQGWNEAQAHPDSYANRPRRNYEMFAGGREAREALQLAINV